MKKFQRYCQHCGKKALTPPSRRYGGGMRSGYVFREGHDLCERCFFALWTSRSAKVGHPLAA